MAQERVGAIDVVTAGSLVMVTAYFSQLLFSGVVTGQQLHVSTELYVFPALNIQLGSLPVVNRNSTALLCSGEAKGLWARSRPAHRQTR